MPTSIKANNEWRDVGGAYIKVDGQWVQAADLLIKVNGEWKSVLILVPNLVGLPRFEVEDVLAADGLIVGQVTTVRTAIKNQNDVVATQNPVFNSPAVSGQAIDYEYFVYLPAVPNIVGQITQNADTILVANDLVVGTKTSTNTSLANLGNTVRSQNPTAGTIVSPDTPVNYDFWNFVATPATPNLSYVSIGVFQIDNYNANFIYDIEVNSGTASRSGNRITLSSATVDATIRARSFPGGDQSTARQFFRRPYVFVPGTTPCLVPGTCPGTCCNPTFPCQVPCQVPGTCCSNQFYYCCAPCGSCGFSNGFACPPQDGWFCAQGGCSGFGPGGFQCCTEFCVREVCSPCQVPGTCPGTCGGECYGCQVPCQVPGQCPTQILQPAPAGYLNGGAEWYRIV